jgi:hypothetical protein
MKFVNCNSVVQCGIYRKPVGPPKDHYVAMTMEAVLSSVWEGVNVLSGPLL